MASYRAGQEKALQLLRHLPSIQPNNITFPGRKSNEARKRGRYGGGARGFKDTKTDKFQYYIPAGYEGNRLPFMLRFPQDMPYRDHHVRRQYPPLSLHYLQLMVDTDRVGTRRCVDLTQLCNSGLYSVAPRRREFGVHLTDEGMDNFSACLDIEVQHAKEHVIAAVERAGGSIISAYYDVVSLLALCDPMAFFKQGKPIPRRQLPPEDAIEYYTSAASRGYLADPAEIIRERIALAQKYGYTLTARQLSAESIRIKDPRQVFEGLDPGWLVNLADKKIYKILDPNMIEYYKS